MEKIRTRFAPSPTGYMHIGNLRTALFAYLLAKKSNGSFVLRIEDTDQKRTIEEAFGVILKSLEKSGIIYDEGPDKDGGFGPYIQSERRDIYKKYIDELLTENKAYRCFCTKEELEAEREKQMSDPDNHIFRDRCRALDNDEIEKKLKENKEFVIRQRVPETGQVSFSDLVFGEITVDCNTLDEQVLIKSDGMPTYNFANVVDDHLMNITHVIRGYEYLSSTPKYNLLYNYFGWDIPKYIHMPHIMKDSGKKLSKRDGDASFQDLLDKGYLETAVVNAIALLGWNPGNDEEIFTMEQLIEKFDYNRISKSNAVFSSEKMDWINSQHIKALPEEGFHNIAEGYYPEKIKEKFDTKKISKIIQGRLNRFTEIPAMIDFLYEVPAYSPDLHTHKKMKTNPEVALDGLKKIIPAFEAVEDWNNEVLFTVMNEVAAKEEMKKTKILWPVRVALSGLPATPGGASEIAAIIGKEETLNRLRSGIELLSDKN